MTDPAPAPTPATAPENNQAPADNQTSQPQPEAPSWYEGADEATVGFIQNKGWDKEPLNAVKAYRELEAFRGVPAEQLVKLPSDPQDFDAVRSIFGKLGAPETPEGYSYELPAEMKEAGAEVDEGTLTWFKSAAAKYGVTQAQFEGILNDPEIGYNVFAGGLEKETAEAVRVKQQNELKALEGEWGPAYTERLAMGRRAAKEFGFTESELEAIEGQIGTAALMKRMAEIGSRMNEANFVEGASSSLSTTGVTPAMAKSEKESLLADIGADKKRFELFGQKQGKDFERIKYLNSIINT